MPGYAKNIFAAGHATTSVTANSVAVTVYNTASSIFDNPGATYCNISCNGVQSGVQSIGFLWYTYTFTGLQPSTSYLVTVDVLYAAGYGGNYGFDTKTVTTLAAPVTRTVTFRHYKGNTLHSTTTASVNNNTTITIANYKQSISNYNYLKATTTASRTGTTATTATITSNTTFYLWYDLNVALWSWTTAENTAFNNGGAFTVLTAARWNAFVDKINAICSASGGSWLTNYSTLAGAKGTSGGALTANKFNSVKFNIGSRVSTGISDVSTGAAVYGSYFITLAAKLNEWILSL